mmetsp:Transcript_1097/g.3125  ORF Transcript_1097/g.3125 Transcript_1097/m.3125 type:complete len:230 (+) Transcript_1097:1463-2152(+)
MHRVPRVRASVRALVVVEAHRVGLRAGHVAAFAGAGPDHALHLARRNFLLLGDDPDGLLELLEIDLPRALGAHLCEDEVALVLRELPGEDLGILEDLEELFPLQAVVVSVVQLHDGLHVVPGALLRASGCPCWCGLRAPIEVVDELVEVDEVVVGPVHLLEQLHQLRLPDVRVPLPEQVAHLVEVQLAIAVLVGLLELLLEQLCRRFELLPARHRPAGSAPPNGRQQAA